MSNTPDVAKGDEIYVRNTDSKTPPAFRAVVKEVVGRGCFVCMDGDTNKRRMVLWSKLGWRPEGPWGKKSLLNGHKPSKKKRKTRKRSLVVQEAPVVPSSSMKTLSPTERLATELVGEVTRLDEKDCAYVLITPTLASRWLDRSDGKNRRKLRNPHVDRYQKIMEEGLWSSRTGDPISIDKSGYMINGQHRLWAVVLSGLSIEMRVIFGVTEDEEKHATDAGNVRTAAVSLKILSRHAATLNAIRRHATGNRNTDPSTNHEVERMWEHYRRHIEWFDSIPGTTTGKAVTRPTDIVGVILRARDCGEDSDLLTAFVQALRRDKLNPGLEHHVNADRTDMVNQLARYLQGIKATSDPSRNERTAKVEWVLKRFLEDRPFSRVFANQEKLWPCPLVQGS